jgi:hypothetical protein
MPIRTLQDCRDNLLRKASLFSFGKDEREKIRCLEALVQLGDFQELQDIFSLPLVSGGTLETLFQIMYFYYESKYLRTSPCSKITPQPPP